ncbi:DNA methyltransferase [uncultured Clostridium sp.]|uniref:DNA methyltransferase n=1 Tax=uncultured Clostridium sp. TaxID=59620 RepID=UPI0026ECF0AB|nr:DNA methyltransferase [uncultured Clostridium sp.]
MNLVQNVFQNPNFIISGDKNKLKQKIAKDIINMYWWNDCHILAGYDSSFRVYANPEIWQIDAANDLYEYYWNKQQDSVTLDKLEDSIYKYMRGNLDFDTNNGYLSTFNMKYRMDTQQFMYDENGEQTFRDGTHNRAFYSLVYLGQNGFIDRDGYLKITDFDTTIIGTKYEKFFELSKHKIKSGKSTVSEEINNLKDTYVRFDTYLNPNLPILEDRKWLYDFFMYVELKCDPFKNYELELLNKNGSIVGAGNEDIYVEIDGKKCANCGMNEPYINGLCKDCQDVVITKGNRSSRVSGTSIATRSINANVQDASVMVNTTSHTYQPRGERVESRERIDRISRASLAADVTVNNDVNSASQIVKTTCQTYRPAGERIDSKDRVDRISSASTSCITETDISTSAAFSTKASATYRPRGIRVSDENCIGGIKYFRYNEDGTVHYDFPSGKIQMNMSVPKGYTYPKQIAIDRFAIYGSFKGNPELLREFCPKNAFVFDPFAGHGDRVLMFAKYGVKTYIGNDTNSREWGYLNNTFMPLLNKYKKFGQHLEVRIKDSKIYEPELENKVDFVYTSPPYFDFEMYDGFEEQIQGMKDYDDFHKYFSTPIFTNVYKYMKDGGIVILQTERIDKYKQKWIDMMTNIGFKCLSSDVLNMKNAMAKRVNMLQEVAIFCKGDYKTEDLKIQSNTLF